MKHGVVTMKHQHEVMGRVSYSVILNDFCDPNPGFKVTVFFETHKRCVLRTKFFRTLIGSQNQCVKWCQFR